MSRIRRNHALASRIVRVSGDAITAFDELHERQMHLIVVRRDLTGFRHLHPHMDVDGTWGTRLRLPAGGAWRAFADFSTGGEQTTLGIDVLAEGEFRPEPLPEAATTVDVAGDVVSLDAADGGRRLRFAVTRDGEPVGTEPYLGAGGGILSRSGGAISRSSTCILSTRMRSRSQ